MKMEQEKLLELIRRSRQGDPEAQDALVRAAQPKIYYHCKKMLKNEEDARDATQDVLIAMITSLDKLREPAAFWGWVNGITANRCKHLLSAPCKEWQIPEGEEGGSMLDSLEDLDEQYIPEKALDNEETRRMILGLVDDLPPEQRMSVLFYYYDEMSVKQIAEAMDTSEGTVKSRLNYARKSIKSGVEDYERKGIKLYGVSPLLLLVHFLRTEAEATSLSSASAAAIAKTVAAAAGSAASGAAVSSAAAGSTAGTTAAASAGTGSAVSGTTTAAAGTAAKAGSAVSTKLIAGVLAGAVAVGGVAVGVNSMGDRADREPEPIVETVEWAALYGGGNAGGLLGTDGSLWLWGNDKTSEETLAHTAFVRRRMDNIRTADLSTSNLAVIKNDGSLWVWGDFANLMSGDRTRRAEAPVKAMDDVAQVSSEGLVIAAVKTDGSLWMWGNAFNDYVLGVEGLSSSAVPIHIMDDVRSVACNGYLTAAVRTDGSLWMWGINNYGALGINTPTSLGFGPGEGFSLPVQVMDDVAQVACGIYFTAALKTDGSLWMWGFNKYGQMGIGTTGYASAPVRVMDGVAQVCCGSNFTAVLKTDGSVWAWGSNRHGELGLDFSVESSADPVKIMDDVAEIVCGNEHTTVLKTDGTVWSWGFNSYGQLGDGTQISSSAPVQVQFMLDDDEAPASFPDSGLSNDLYQAG